MSWALRWAGAIAMVLGLAQTANAQTTVRYVHTDALGSVVAMTDENREVVEGREYEPYGQQTTALDNGPGFTGHVQDAASGLTYMQQRYYDPIIGRFLSVDPVVVETKAGWNFNRYGYAANNPYRFTDPDGRMVEEGLWRDKWREGLRQNRGGFDNPCGEPICLSGGGGDASSSGDNEAERILGGLTPSSADEVTFRIDYSKEQIGEVAIALNKLAVEARGASLLTADGFGPERAMLARVLAGFGDSHTLAWFRHEIAEARGMRKFMHLQGVDYELANRDVHLGVLAAHGNQSTDLYSPSVVRSYPEEFAGIAWDKARATWGD